MMRKIRIIGVILLVCVVCISGCQDERSTKSQKRYRTSGLILNEKEIQREMKYLNSHYLLLYVDASSSFYDINPLGYGDVWYVNRDKQKAYAYSDIRDDWTVRIGKKGYWISPEKVSSAGDSSKIKEMEQGLDSLFRFYAMINVRDNTPRMYKRGDKGFEELASYYDKAGGGDKEGIVYFKVKEGKIKNSTYVYVQQRSYNELDQDDFQPTHIDESENLTEIVFDVDQNSFDATYEELKQLVKTLPRDETMNKEEKE